MAVVVITMNILEALTQNHLLAMEIRNATRHPEAVEGLQRSGSAPDQAANDICQSGNDGRLP